jgi:site-specific DNA-methyltransferase (adenine-specific)
MLYHSEPAGDIHWGDCLEVMREIPDKSVDLVLTDPPYEDECHSSNRRVIYSGRPKKSQLDFSRIDDETRMESAKEISRIAKGWVLVFCQIEAIHKWRDAFEKAGMKYRRTCVWVKPDGLPNLSGDGPGMGYEVFMAFHKIGTGKSRWNGGGRHGVFIFPKGETKFKGNSHQTIKPIKLFHEIVSLFSDPGDLILDPFLGSGTTARAAKDLGRKFIGIELEEKYCAIAKKRLEQEVLF